MFNSKRDKAFLAGGATFALCLVAMLAGGLTWFTTAAGWCVFLAFVLSVFAGFVMWLQLNEAEAQEWRQDRRDVYDRMQDAQRCIKSEEKAHEYTKAQLRSANRQITDEHEKAQRYLKQYNEAKDAQEAMRIRCGQRDGVIKELRAEIDELQKANFTEATDNANKLEEIRQQVERDNDTWRQQVSNMREAAYKLAVHIEGSANGLPDEWEAWGAELAQDLRALAGAGGVQADERQIPIEGTTTVEEEIEAVAVIEPVSRDAWATPAETLDAMQVAEFKAVPLPAAQNQPNPIHVAHQLMAKVRENQAQRKANLDVILKAVENGYELSDAFNAAYHRGIIWVTDELIAKERNYIEHSQPSE